jgi:lysophospholipase L1-like esterase
MGMTQSQMTVYLAGDSTVADYPSDRLPMLGWGAKLPAFLDPQVRVVNAAVNGRSSKSFIEEGRLDAVLERIQEGDALLVQFGHNDSKDDEARHTDPWDTYPMYLSRYIAGAKVRGAHPILISPVARRHFDTNGKLLDSHGEYPKAMRELAFREGVPFIGLCGISMNRLLAMGDEAAKGWFTWLQPGEHPHYPDGIQDDTHLNEKGAEAVARLVAEQLAALSTPLKDRVRL